MDEWYLRPSPWSPGNKCPIHKSIILLCEPLWSPARGRAQIPFCKPYPHGSLNHPVLLLLQPIEPFKHHPTPPINLPILSFLIQNPIFLLPGVSLTTIIPGPLANSHLFILTMSWYDMGAIPKPLRAKTHLDLHHYSLFSQGQCNNQVWWFSWVSLHQAKVQSLKYISPLSQKTIKLSNAS